MPRPLGHAGILLLLRPNCLASLFQVESQGAWISERKTIFRSAIITNERAVIIQGAPDFRQVISVPDSTIVQGTRLVCRQIL